MKWSLAHEWRASDVGKSLNCNRQWLARKPIPAIHLEEIISISRLSLAHCFSAAANLEQQASFCKPSALARREQVY